MVQYAIDMLRFLQPEACCKNTAFSFSPQIERPA